ncbi:glycosyltransferase family 4 protein [Compostimonas suwonensis]|uniref:glycosyltransferase family 4 protein n=1 Tax=Compostimonas suwonensis TaxID=1048394 RepID=UPI000C244468|nr:glycosyltransferase family 1 protein [Compostimonas suwonensis]
MRIVFDCRYTRFDRHDGISRYTSSLVEALGRLHPVIMLINDHRQLALLPDLPWELVSAPTSAREPFVARQVNRLKPDVVFSPMQTMGSFGRRYRLALTVHDLIYYRNRTPPRELPQAIRLLWRLYHLAWWPQRMLLNRSDAVVTVSQTTESLIEEHRLTRRPITVVRNAAGRARVPSGAADRSAGPLSRSLVYMGSFMPYKNVETLVRVAGRLPDYELHLMSRVGDADRERLRRVAPGARLVFHDGASDEEYRAVLWNATALVSASLDEGFGIPLVESMSLGTPVVVSDIPIFREIGGEAALFAEPHDDAAFATAIRSLESPDEWLARSDAARARAALFDWDASAEALLELLSELGARSGRGSGSDRRR